MAHRPVPFPGQVGQSIIFTQELEARPMAPVFFRLFFRVLIPLPQP